MSLEFFQNFYESKILYCAGKGIAHFSTVYCSRHKKVMLDITVGYLRLCEQIVALLCFCHVKDARVMCHRFIRLFKV